MITSVSELEKILAICEEVKAELREQGVTYSDTMELGIMIETPAAAIISDRLAPMVDFFSVGYQRSHTVHPCLRPAESGH